MKCNAVILFTVWFVLWARNLSLAQNTEIGARQDPILLEFWQRDGKKSIKFTENESISFVEGDQLSIKCITENVHTWKGILNHQKFIREIGTIRRNFTGYFQSFVNVTLESTMVFSNSTPLICKELGKKGNSGKCIHFHSEREKNSNESKKDEKQSVLVTVDTCQQIAMHEDKNFGEAVSKTTPPPFPVLDFCVPYFQLIDRTIVKFYGMASKHTIIQSPEVLITSKDGKIVRLDVEILPEPQDHKTRQFYTFKMVANLTVNMKTIHAIGYRYDSSEAIVVKKDLNVTVGMRPKIEGLPHKIELYQANSDSYFRFRAFGHPRPRLNLFFNDQTIKANDPRFQIYQHSMDNYTFHIRKITDERLTGKFKITAINVFGKHEKSIKFQGNFQWTLADARLIGFGIFITLFSLIIICIVLCKPRNDDKTEPIAHNANKIELRERTAEGGLSDVCNSVEIEILSQPTRNSEEGI